MKLNSTLFEAFLKCPTKCFLLSRGEVGSGNLYADWIRKQNESYLEIGTKQLVGAADPNDCVFGRTFTEIRQKTNWRLAFKCSASGDRVEANIHVLGRMPSEKNGAAARLALIRFEYTNKLSKDDKLLAAFDSFVLRISTGSAEIRTTIVYGENYARSKINTDALSLQIKNKIAKAITQVSAASPPDLILNRHCVECEFQSRCREKALENDELSLLAGMTEKERKRLNNKGIFSVTQLSFTFRPRRRPKRQRNKREKYHHSLKALAIKLNKIHIVGAPQLKIEGTPVYLDVEALPHKHFYYLIGVQISTGDAVEQHSFWADDIESEKTIWNDFLAMLSRIDNPVLVHYGSFETIFLKRMFERYGEPSEESVAFKAAKSSVNLVSVLFGQVYFPTYSNGLKEIGAWLGCKWSSKYASGAQSIVWRSNWELSSDTSVKQTLVTYNLEDCHALSVLTETMIMICNPDSRPGTAGVTASSAVAHADEATTREGLWRRFSSPIADFEIVNKAARWDYQRDRVYVRTDKLVKDVNANHKAHAQRAIPINQTINCEALELCPICGGKTLETYPGRSKGIRSSVLYDVRFIKGGFRRWLVRFHFRLYLCTACDKYVGTPEEFWPKSQYGRNLVGLIVYEIIELCMPQMTVKENLNRLLGLRLAPSMVYDLKVRAAAYYAETRERILGRMIKGDLIHADETLIPLRDRKGYVWVFATLHEVAYFYADSREADVLRERLKGFTGVLVSDFYAGYDSFPSRQQKCLLHLMRDFNEAVLKFPYDMELRGMVTAFGDLLKRVVQTIDRWGLKRRYLRKHEIDVERFYLQLKNADYRSDAALSFKDRVERNKEKLFTFLQYDGIPWNNNNAEHAIKAFARLRRIVTGISSPSGIEDYLILLSVCQTCKYSGIDFLDFLRSGDKTLDASAKFKASRR